MFWVGGLLYLYSLLHYPSPKLDSHLLRTRMIRTQRLYDTRSLHTTLGPLPGLCQPGTTGGGQCSALIAYFYWAPITWSWSLVNPIRPLDGIKPRTSQDLAIRNRGTFTLIAAVSLSCGEYLAFNLGVAGPLTEIWTWKTVELIRQHLMRFSPYIFTDVLT